MRMHLMLMVCVGLNLVAQPKKIPGSNLDNIAPRTRNVGDLPVPTRPLVRLPNPMIRFAPQRRDNFDLQITDFPLTLVSHRLGQVPPIKPHINKIDKTCCAPKSMYVHNLHTAAKNRWSKFMSQLNIEGAAELQKRSFYTSLYRYSEQMVHITEDGHYYSGYDRKVNDTKRRLSTIPLFYS